MMSGKDARNHAVIQMLHGPPDEPAPDADDDAPAFDGGVRETAPGPSDPVADHNELLIGLLRNLPIGAGGQW